MWKNINLPCEYMYEIQKESKKDGKDLKNIINLYLKEKLKAKQRPLFLF